jgi:cytochrome c peroxidase
MKVGETLATLGWLSAATALAAVAAAQSPPADSAFDWRLPAAVAPPPVPADNPMTAAKVELGRRLFYDADLSVDGTLSCATCHEQHRAFTDGNATHPGVHDSPGRRNVMGLANVAYFLPLTWADPSQISLEDQTRVPIMGTTPVEMGMAGHADEIASRLKADDCYRRMFAAAFPETRGQISMTNVSKALAAFERTLLSFDSPWDREQRGDKTALNASAKRGEALFFGKTFNCASCHARANFTDADQAHAPSNGAFHDIGLYNLDGQGAYPASDHGLRERSQRPRDEGKIRTPSLRNVAVTGPYMHDGSVPDLALAIVRHYGPGTNKLRDKRLAGPAPDALQTQDLLAFLNALTDANFINDSDFSLPKTACGKPL